MSTNQISPLRTSSPSSTRLVEQFRMLQLEIFSILKEKGPITGKSHIRIALEVARTSRDVWKSLLSGDEQLAERYISKMVEYLESLKAEIDDIRSMRENRPEF